MVMDKETRDRNERVRLAVAVVVAWDANPKGKPLAVLITDALKAYGHRTSEDLAAERCDEAADCIESCNLGIAEAITYLRTYAAEMREKAPPS
jgi:hypothetical protein